MPVAASATFFFARERMDSLIAAATVWHVLGGAVLGMLLVPSLILKRQGALSAKVSLAVIWATGIALLAAAAAGVSTGRLPVVLALHIWMGLLTFALLAGGKLKRSISRLRTPSPVAIAALLSTSATAVLAAASYQGYQAEEYYRHITATNAGQSGNPLFPAGSMRSEESGWRAAPAAQDCGASGCHPDLWRQWSSSRHAKTAAAIHGNSDSRWCEGCHATGSLIKNPGAGASAAAVDCLACHAMSQVPLAAGNGLALFSPPTAYPFANGAAPRERWIHDFLLRLRPAPHVASLAGPSIKGDRSQACVPCHRMAVGVAQNHYKYLRYDDTWADWQSGPYSQESLHAFRLSPQRRDCIDCHMSRGVRGSADHACPAQLATESPNRDLRVEIFALRQQTGMAGAERLDAPLENRPIAVSPGASLDIDIVVENRGIGHSFPAATQTGESVWLAFEVRDASGRLLFASPSERDLSAHRYGQLALDRDGSPLGPADKDRMVTTAYRRFIGPGEADVAHYRLMAPHNPGAGGLRLHARLIRRQTADPMSSVTVLAEHRIVLGVRSGEMMPAAIPTRKDDPAGAPQFYAYGVGLLQQGDNGRARRAFAEAILLAPKEPLYRIGAARASLAEGDRLAARASLDAALRLQPDFPLGQAWLGTVLRETGQYREALAVLTPLSKRFPRDKQLWMEIGWCSLKTADNEQAAEAFQTALAIDPDDAAAHYNLMQSYLHLRQLAEARREETVFHALQEDEPLRGILDPFYAAHPDARMESQPVHEHVLKPLQRQPQ